LQLSSPEQKRERGWHMIMILNEQVLMLHLLVPLITLHLWKNRQAAALRPGATILPEITALNKQMRNYNKDKGNGTAQQRSGETCVVLAVFLFLAFQPPLYICPSLCICGN
jgi:hypothetical protein